MKTLVRMYIFTLLVFTVTIVCLAYGYIFSNSDIFYAGDMLGIPMCIIMFAAYRKEYYEQLSNVRNFK